MWNNIINYNIIKNLKKRLIKGIKSSGGRNNLGRVCIKGRGLCNSSYRGLFRFLDLYRRINKYGFILNIYYDPNRTGKIGLVLYENGLTSYILLQKNLKVLDTIYSGSVFEKKIKQGYSLPLKLMPLFSVLSNIERKPFYGGNICKAAGVSSLLISKESNKNKCILKLNSGWELPFSLDSMSSYGPISVWSNKIIGKAGKNRGLGVKSKVRGVAKNPCDHPHGGGNGKKSKPVQPVNAWKTVFKWTPTKNKKHQLLKKRLYKVIN